MERLLFSTYATDLSLKKWRWGLTNKEEVIAESRRTFSTRQDAIIHGSYYLRLLNINVGKEAPIA